MVNKKEIFQRLKLTAWLKKLLRRALTLQRIILGGQIRTANCLLILFVISSKSGFRVLRYSITKSFIRVLSIMQTSITWLILEQRMLIIQWISCLTWKRNSVHWRLFLQKKIRQKALRRPFMRVVQSPMLIRNWQEKRTCWNCFYVLRWKYFLMRKGMESSMSVYWMKVIFLIY